LPTLFTPLAFLIITSAANNNQKASGVKRVGNARLALTCKGTKFVWTEECQIAFNNLKERLVTAPVSAYPNFDKNFILEIDASIKGIGAVLSQQQEDGQVHPVAFASRALGLGPIAPPAFYTSNDNLKHKIPLYGCDCHVTKAQ